MPESFNIKKLHEKNFSEMREILQRASHDWNSSILKDCFHSGYSIWGIFRKAMLVGFVVIHEIIDSWEILQIVIDCDYQRQGLATQLMQFVFDQARENKIKKIQLEVRASNHAAMLLYQRLHFHQVGVRKKYYADGEDAVLMDCVI